MGKLNVEICSETGICSIVKEDGSKVDLMPDEVDGLRAAAGKAESVKKVIAEVDDSFAAKLSPEELKELAAQVK